MSVFHDAFVRFSGAHRQELDAWAERAKQEIADRAEHARRGLAQRARHIRIEIYAKHDLPITERDPDYLPVLQAMRNLQITGYAHAVAAITRREAYLRLVVDQPQFFELKEFR